MKIRISSDGRIALPAKLRRRDRIKAGEQFRVERIRSGEYRLTHIAEHKGEGVVDWLLDCPVKGFFVPIESTHTDGRDT